MEFFFIFGSVFHSEKSDFVKSVDFVIYTNFVITDTLRVSTDPQELKLLTFADLIAMKIADFLLNFKIICFYQIMMIRRESIVFQRYIITIVWPGEAF